MQYLLLIYEAEEIFENMSDEEKGAVMASHGAMHEYMQARGIDYSGEPLMPTSTAVSVRFAGGEPQATDGPFAETKEQLGGFYLVDVPDVDEAVKLAGMLKETLTGTVEIRPVADYSEHV